MSQVRFMVGDVCGDVTIRSTDPSGISARRTNVELARERIGMFLEVVSAA